MRQFLLVPQDAQSFVLSNEFYLKNKVLIGISGEKRVEFRHNIAGNRALFIKTLLHWYVVGIHYQ